MAEQDSGLPVQTEQATMTPAERAMGAAWTALDAAVAG